MHCEEHAALLLPNGHIPMLSMRTWPCCQGGIVGQRPKSCDSMQTTGCEMQQTCGQSSAILSTLATSLVNLTHAICAQSKPAVYLMMLGNML